MLGLWKSNVASAATPTNLLAILSGKDDTAEVVEKLRSKFGKENVSN